MTEDLQRFLDAQDRVYAQVCTELRAGEKQTHWMWFIFPQLEGLGHSPMARRYAIVDQAQAAAYLAHPVLGDRLRECVRLVTARSERTPLQIFGSPDYLKLHSSLTLFHGIAPADPLFSQALQQLHGGKVDQATMERLRSR